MVIPASTLAISSLSMKPKPALALAALFTTATATAAAEPLPPSTFAYDAKAPIDLRDEAPAQKRGEVTVRDVSFAATTEGARTRAYLVLPRDAAASSGALWVHWLGEKASNRDEFLGDAVELAGSGTVSLLVDAQWSAPHWFTTRTTDTDYDASIRQVKDLRRALDVLLGQKGVDKGRIAYIGHDFGGMYGSILAAVDPRPQTLVILAVTTKLSDWFLLGAPPKSKPDYVAKMAPIEPLPYLAKAKPGAVFFQFAKTDEYVTKEHADEYVAAARPTSGEKKVMTYDADHDLDVPAAHTDRLAWLRAHLAR
jgi:dienelactone hydrolase